MLFLDPFKRELADIGFGAYALALEIVVARHQAGRLAYKFADGAYVPEPVMPPETAEDPQSIRCLHDAGIAQINWYTEEDF